MIANLLGKLGDVAAPNSAKAVKQLINSLTHAIDAASQKAEAIAKTVDSVASLLKSFGLAGYFGDLAADQRKSLQDVAHKVVHFIEDATSYVGTTLAGGNARA